MSFVTSFWVSGRGGWSAGSRQGLAALSSLLLAGCEMSVDLPEPAHTARVALVYTLQNQPVSIDTINQPYTARQQWLYVSGSQRLFDTKQLVGRTDATVEIRNAAGTVVERFWPLKNRDQYDKNAGYYVPTLGLIGEPGQTYTLRAAVPGLETAESTLTLPPPVAGLENGTYVPLNVDSYGKRCRLTLTLRDNPATTDYYLVTARLLDQAGRPTDNYLNRPYGNDDFNVGRLQLSSPGNSNSYPYADTNVNGQAFTLNTEAYYYESSNPNQPKAGYIEVLVSTLTADTYRFYQSRRIYYENDGNPFAEPTPITSNIRPGYGLFGGATVTAYRIKLP